MFMRDGDYINDLKTASIVLNMNVYIYFKQLHKYRLHFLLDRLVWEGLIGCFFAMNDNIKANSFFSRPEFKEYYSDISIFLTPSPMSRLVIFRHRPLHPRLKKWKNLTIKWDRFHTNLSCILWHVHISYSKYINWLDSDNQKSMKWFCTTQLF